MVCLTGPPLARPLAPGKLLLPASEILPVSDRLKRCADGSLGAPPATLTDEL